MSLIKNSLLLFFAIVFFTSARSNGPELKIANTLQSNMVIQQGKPLVVWGTADAGTKIVVKADWQNKAQQTVAANNGEWKVEVSVPLIKSGDFTPHLITVNASGQQRSLQNILFGDVWLCSGQSNMDMTIKPLLPWLLGAFNYHYEIDNANYPQIRLFDVGTDFKAEEQKDCKGEWKICSPQTAGDFSAVAYFFAREIFNRTKIPQGIITSAVGGSSCQAWVSRKTLTTDSVLFKRYLFPYNTSAQSKEPLDSVVTFEKVLRPTLFYNAMIYPLRNIHFSGALWYQGESNRHDGALYTDLCGAMINNWRTLFGDNALPFYYVQVAPYYWQENDSTAFEYALLREAQSKIVQQVSNTGMASTMDIPDPTDLHPRNKQDVGYRLAKIALSQKYKLSGVVYRGPEYSHHIAVNDTIKITFKPETVGSGLATNDGQNPRHFYVAGKNGVLHYAYATIIGNEVSVFSPKVKTPVAVRYAFTNYPITNFENNEGLPAVPFRTDTINSKRNNDDYAKSRIVIKPAPEWDEMLKRDSGWIGADGIYAVPLNGVEQSGQADETETLLWFSDDIWGKINDDTLANDWEMAHNCVAYLKGGAHDKNKIEFFSRRDAKGNTLSMFEPQTPNAVAGDYYWLGDGFFNHALDSTIYIFAYRIKNVPGGIYPFDDVGLSLIAIPKNSRPPFKDQRQLDTPFFLKDSKGKGKVVFGVSVLANTVGAGAPNPDGFIYVYGVRGPYKQLIVARVEDKAFEEFSKWKFWNGSEWVKDINECAALTDRVSNEMSVSFMEDGRVLAVYQLDTNSPEVVMQAAKSPVGPFQLRKKIWSTPEIYDDLDFYTYNAKAHPHLSKPGELLVSYNVNSFDFLPDIKYHPWHLRPRFFTIKY
jgi:sialate O-acetylesterase